MSPAGTPVPDFVREQLVEPPHTAGEIAALPEFGVVGRRVVNGAGATVAAQGVKFCLRFGSAIVLGRLLVPADFGIVAMVSPVLAFIGTLNDLGFAQAIVQRRDITAAQVSHLFWINVLASLVLAAVLMLAAPLVGWLYGEPRTVGITLAMTVSLVIGTLGIVPSALLSRQMRFVAASAIEVGSLVVSVGLSIGLALAGFGYWSLVLAQIASTATGMVAVFAAAGWRPRFRHTRAPIGSLVRFGANLTGVNLATYVSMMADNIIVGAVAGKNALGLYDRSYTLALQPLGQLMAPLGRVAMPLLSRFEDDPDRLRWSYLLMVRLGVLLTAPAMIVCVVLHGPVIALLLGPRWAAAAPVFAWICLGGVFASIFSSTGWLFTVQDRTGEQLRLSLATAAISVASFAIGIAWGVEGVAAASSLSFILLQTPLMLRGLTRTGCVGRADLGRALWPAAVAGALTVLAVLLAGRIVFPVNVFVAGALAYAVFGAAMLALPGGTALRGELWRLRDLVRGRAG